jgi:hypothetical protein
MPNLVALVSLAGFLVPAPASAQTTSLVLDSQPGDYVGGGIKQTFTESHGTFEVQRNFDNGVSLTFDGGSHWWRLDFAAPGDAALSVGPFEGARRFPFQLSTEPGLSVVGEGRGCNTLTGRFDVLEVEYGPGGEVLRFAAAFEQHCEGRGPALFGSILFNSTLPPPPSVPYRCPPAKATIPELLEEVSGLFTSVETQAALTESLQKAQQALDDSAPRRARTSLVQFMSRAVKASNRKGSDPNSIELSAGNRLVCGAGNVLTNITIP